MQSSSFPLSSNPPTVVIIFHPAWASSLELMYICGSGWNARVRCFEDLEATAVLKAKPDGTVTVDSPVPDSNKPDRLGYGSTAPSPN